MSRRRRILSGILRWAFVVAVVGFAAVSFQSDGDTIVAAMLSTNPLALALALALAAAGTIASAPIWRSLLSLLGQHVPWRASLRILFVGQLGKYIPGSVWSVGAHAKLAAPYGVPVRSALTASAAFIGYHLAGGLAVGAAAVMLGWVEVPAPRWIGLAVVATCAIAFLPPVLSRILTLAARTTVHVSSIASLAALGLAAISWTCWGLSLAALIGGPASGALNPPMVVAIGAYALAYVAGLVILLAPAGFGIREAVLVALLTPSIGVARAAGVAILSRLISTLSDFVLAIVTHLLDRRRPSGGELP